MSRASEELLAQAVTLLEAGRVAEAAAVCDEVVSRDPALAAAHNLLGVVAGRSGAFAAAATHFARAAALEPGRGEYQRNLGFAQRQAGRLAEAAESLARAIALDDGDVVALHELGRLHQAQGDIEAAAGCYRRLLDRDPGNVLVLLAYGNVLAALGRLEAAADAMRRALALAPDSADARFSLACVLGSLGHPADAAALYREIERVRPDYPGLQLNLGFELKRLGRCAEAIRHYDLAIAQDPGNFTAYSNRGNALQNQQRMGEAVASFRQALAIKPDYAVAHSNLLLSLNYTETSQQVIYQESLRFEQQHAAQLRPPSVEHPNGREPGRRLRVGYVSADFRFHSVAYFIRGVLAAHDRRQVEVYCYANQDRSDAMTAQIRSLADHWREIAGTGDAEVARQVRADAIDILVDLGGHTAGNRLLVFARKPAPIQISWLGYPNTTGLRTMDYRLTDLVADPGGEADELHTERLIRLPDGFLCYQPEPVQPPVAPADAGVTFGSFNALVKLTPGVAAAWSAILRGVPGSRLLLKSESLDEEETRRRFVAMFTSNGIEAERLELLPPVGDHAAHVRTYARVDIALDPFPYNGTTTTCEALSMGVPVVVLRGNRHAGRVGASILQHAGLGEWIADSPEEYVSLARARAVDSRNLAAMRPAIREAMRAAVLTHPERFTPGLERVYRRAWLDWCAARTPPPDSQAPGAEP